MTTCDSTTVVLKDDFTNKVEALIAKQTQERDALRGQLLGVQRRVDEMDAALSRLTASLETYRDLMSPKEAQPSSGLFDEGKQHPIPLAAQHGTIGELARLIIGRDGGPRSTMKVADIVRELKAVGKLRGGGATGRGDYGTVFRTLSRDPRFVKVGPGEFQLVDPEESVPRVFVSHG